MRAAFHAGRLQKDCGAFDRAASLLGAVLAHNPAHRAARDLLDEIAGAQVTA